MLGVRNSSTPDTTHIRGIVPSKRGTVSWNEQILENSAVQIRVAPETFRGIYLRVKKRVQAIRSKRSGRVLSGVQLRPEETPGAVEHT